MKAFISNVDTPLGHNLSRILSLTPVGSRSEGQEEEEEVPPEANPEAVPVKKEKPPKENYHIIGSLKNDKADFLKPQIRETGDKKKDAARREAQEKFCVPSQAPKWVNQIINSRNSELKDTILSSDVIVYDLSTALEEFNSVLEILTENAEKFEKPKTLIVISTIMTWAKTKIENDNAESLTEDEFRRRKAHPNFKAYLNAEKEATKLGKKNNIKSYVITPGLIYHAGDSIFHFLLKDAWHNAPFLKCFGDGSNILPTIHLDDLVNIIVEVIETTPESKYLVAVDDSKSSLMEITKAIAEALGSGNVKTVEKEEIFIDKRFTQVDHDLLTCNLRIDSGHVKEMSVEWKYEAGLIENINALVTEYKDYRGLWPIKIMIHGPPSCRKTYFSTKISEKYGLHLIDPDLVMQEAVENLERKLSQDNTEDGASEELEADRELLNELKDTFKTNNGKYLPAQILNFVKEKLRSMPCRNQGYVLDGYPNLIDEASEIFKANEDEAKEDSSFPVDESTIPEFIFSLNASENYIKQQVMRLPESALAGTKNSEEALSKRLEEYLKINTDENTVLNFFDEVEIHPINFSLETMDLSLIEEQMYKIIGTARNYGPTLEQLEEEKRQIESARAKVEALAAEERARKEAEELERHKKAVAEWNQKLEEVRKQEQEVLQAQSLPLRNYLMKHIIPTLTAGLIEVAKTRPEDPIDYLAEFLFKQNPIND